MAEQDNSINTNSVIKDGGMALDQNDVSSYIRILIEQRNDATDAMSVFRTKCVRYVSMLEMASEQIKTLTEKNEELMDKLKVYEPNDAKNTIDANTN